jgi:hypothetical protein
MQARPTINSGLNLVASEMSEEIVLQPRVLYRVVKTVARCHCLAAESGSNECDSDVQNTTSLHVLVAIFGLIDSFSPITRKAGRIWDFWVSLSASLGGCESDWLTPGQVESAAPILNSGSTAWKNRILSRNDGRCPDGEEVILNIQ